LPIDSVAEIAVVSASRYRAESLALSLSREAAYKVDALTSFDVAALARFPIVLIELDSDLEAALQATHAITAHHPAAKVILLGLVESEENIVSLAEAGASGYAAPASSLQELTTVIHSVQKGEFICTPAITYSLFSYLANLAGINSMRAPAAVLSGRERQVLRLMSQDFSNKEIAERLCLSTCTVKNHVHHILKKWPRSSLIPKPSRQGKGRVAGRTPGSAAGA